MEEEELFFDSVTIDFYDQSLMFSITSSHLRHIRPEPKACLGLAYLSSFYGLGATGRVSRFFSFFLRVGCAKADDDLNCVIRAMTSPAVACPNGSRTQSSRNQKTTSEPQPRLHSGFELIRTAL